ncbi:hypothetical protein GCM10027614_04560 [Micromonospora vulcania]
MTRALVVSASPLVTSALNRGLGCATITIWASGRRCANRRNLERRGHPDAPVLAAVHGGHDELAGRVDPLRRLGRAPVDEVPERVYDGVAGHHDGAGGDALADEVRPGRAGGARCRAAIRASIARLASSGNGRSRSLVRRPASRCTTGTWRQNAAAPPARAVVVSPAPRPPLDGGV